MSQVSTKQQLKPILQWARDQWGDIEWVESLAREASARCYYRLGCGDRRVILVDGSRERTMLQAQVDVSTLLASLELPIPSIYGYEDQQGWLLLRDFGDMRLLDVPPEAQSLWYRSAIDLIGLIQACPEETRCVLPRFDRKQYIRKFDLFKSWFIEGQPTHHQQQRCDAALSRLLSVVESLPSVCMHRDYHSTNIMVLDNDQGLGLIDYQSAAVGPMGYDLVSLLRDCYIDWSETFVAAHCRYFYDTHVAPTWGQTISYATFELGFDWLGVARHLKCLGLFKQIATTRNQRRYLSYLPRVCRYLQTMSARYDELDFLQPLIEPYLESL